MHIVKRRGHKEEYDSRKVYASVYRACLNVHMEAGEAELIADKVSKEINAWIEKRKEVTSSEIFHSIVVTLKQYTSEAAFMYETHRDLS